MITKTIVVASYIKQRIPNSRLLYILLELSTLLMPAHGRNLAFGG